MPFLLRPAIQILICLVLYGALVWWGGAFVATITSPGLAAVLAVPIINLMRDLRLVSSGRAWKDVQGKHYAYHGQAVHVMEDDDHCRWVRMADVRKIVGVTATDRPMAHTYKNAWTLVGRKSVPYIREDALVAHLTKENKHVALRLGHWVQREIAFPGERIRKRLGIYMQPFQSKGG
jgi:hypothetical protein